MPTFRNIRFFGARPLPLGVKIVLGLVAIPVVLVGIPLLFLLGRSLNKKMRELEKKSQEGPNVIIDVQPKTRKQLPRS